MFVTVKIVLQKQPLQFIECIIRSKYKRKLRESHLDPDTQSLPAVSVKGLVERAKGLRFIRISPTFCSTPVHSGGAIVTMP